MRRGWARGAAVVAASLGLGGCLVVNGAFEAAEGEGSGSSSGSPDGSSTTALSGGSAEPGTSSGEGSGGASASSSSSSSTGSDASSSGEATGTTTSTDSSSTGPDACAGLDGDQCSLQSIGGQDYWTCERVGTWEEARLACEARCARLAILDEAESAALLTALRDQMTAEDIAQEMSGEDSVAMPRASWWIGGHKVDGAYQWLDGTPMPAKGTGGWYSNDPDIDGADGCVVIGVFGKGDANGKWFDRPCGDVPHRSICDPL